MSPFSLAIKPSRLVAIYTDAIRFTLFPLVMLSLKFRVTPLPEPDYSGVESGL
jgi:hypothetical protein